jgi:hypothetical protein
MAKRPTTRSSRVSTFSKLVFSLLLATGAYADTITLTLDPNFPGDYSFYSYTATDNSNQSNIPVAPYSAILSDTDGLFTNVPVFTICYDLNNPTYVGYAYPGHLANNTDQASLEATYLANKLNLAGNGAATTALKGAISFAIWEIMFPSSTKTEGSYFPADPAAAALESEAYQAVTSGTWTVQDASLYPTFIPDDASSQRFGLIFSNTPPVSLSSAPEPGGVLLFGSGVAIVALLRRVTRKMSGRSQSPLASRQSR